MFSYVQIVFNMCVHAKPATTTPASLIYRTHQFVFCTFLHRHLLGVSVLVKKGYLVAFKSCKTDWLVFRYPYILQNLTSTELLIVIAYRSDFAISVNYAFPSYRKAVEAPFVLPPPTAFVKKDL